MHQSAEKSTSTVAPFCRRSVSRSREKGSHGITDVTGPRNMKARLPTVPTIPAAWTQRPNPMSPARASCARPIHQQAAQMPMSSAKVGTNQSWSRNVNRKTTVPSITKPSTSFSVSIQAPGFGRNFTRAGNTPTSRYGSAMPVAMEAKTA